VSKSKIKVIGVGGGGSLMEVDDTKVEDKVEKIWCGLTTIKSVHFFNLTIEIKLVHSAHKFYTCAC